MAYKLEKTYLSQKLRPGALFIAILSFLILLFIFSMDPESFQANGQMVFEKKQYWKAFTSALLHADLNHLSHNAFFFTGLAFILNGYFGSLVFPFLCLGAGGVINFITLYFYPPEVHLVGISGVVYFMAAFWLTSFILIERRQSLFKRIIYALGMSLIFLFPESFLPNTSYLAHACGFFMGIPAAIAYFILHKQNIRNAEVWVLRPETPVDFDWEVPDKEGHRDDSSKTDDYNSMP